MLVVFFKAQLACSKVKRMFFQSRVSFFKVFKSLFQESGRFFEKGFFLYKLSVMNAK